MSQENLEIVRHSGEMLARRDYDAFLASCDPEIEFVLPDGGINTGIRRGRQALRGLLDDYLASFADVQFEAERFYDAGDSVIASMRMTALGRGSGIAVEFRSGFIFTLAEGKVTRIRVVPEAERPEVLKAAGLAE